MHTTEFLFCLSAGSYGMPLSDSNLARIADNNPVSVTGGTLQGGAFSGMHVWIGDLATPENRAARISR
jgi:hypothetical protein